MAKVRDMIDSELLLPLVALVIVVLHWLLLLRSWLAPGVLFPLFWLWLIVLSFMIAPDYPVWHGAIWWMTVSLALFSLGTGLGDLVARRPSDSGVMNAMPERELPGLRILIGLGLLGQLVYMVLFDVFVTDFVYERPPLLIQPFLSCFYSTLIFGGMMLGSDMRRRDYMVALAPVVPWLVWLFAGSGRSGLASIVGFYFAGYAAVRVWRRQDIDRIFEWRLLAVSQGLVAGVVFLAVFATQVRQEGITDAPITQRLAVAARVVNVESLEDIWLDLRHGVGGHVYAFSYWLERAWYRPLQPRYGLLTFAGPLELVGVATREPFESFEIDPGVWSNVYTLFRNLIDDFGFSGSLLWFFASGVVTGVAYHRVRAGDVRWMVILIVFYMYATSIGGHALVYNSIILAFLMVGFYWWWYGRRRGRMEARASAGQPCEPYSGGSRSPAGWAGPVRPN